MRVSQQSLVCGSNQNVFLQTCERIHHENAWNAHCRVAERGPAKNVAHSTEVIEVILSPSDRYMQTIRKAPSYKPVDNLGVNSDRCWNDAIALSRAPSLHVIFLMRITLHALHALFRRFPIWIVSSYQCTHHMLPPHLFSPPFK